MTSEEFVKKHYPDARAHFLSSNYNFGMKHRYTVIKASSSCGLRNCIIASGDNESKAWVAAKKRIKEENVNTKKYWQEVIDEIQKQ